MKESPIYFSVIFLISFAAIALELFVTSILNLKTWNHIVYLVIPLAILGYGIGGNIYLVFKDYIDSLERRRFTASLLLLLSFLIIASTFLIIFLPIRISYFENFFNHFDIAPALLLLIAYTIFAVPFVLIGFLTVYLFSLHHFSLGKLYFFDLLGAGSAASIFFFLISYVGPFRSILLIALLLVLLSAILLPERQRLALVVVSTLSIIVLIMTAELSNFATIDTSKGWEWIPGYLQYDQYETLVSDWHPLGLTHMWNIIDGGAEASIYNASPSSFEINVSPIPNMTYTATNFLSGTPIYNFSKAGLLVHDSTVKPFSTVLELPYLLINKPSVVVIGVGGGRDIFTAKTHEAKEIVGAETNPVIYRELSLGGKLYDYSGQLYSADGVKVFNVDGRHLVKNLDPNHYDLIILNGVDTFSGLTAGAYTYAESYLYTKEAVMDYLRLLNEDGILYFIRWINNAQPREELRLFAIITEALRLSGIDKPLEHIVVGGKGYGSSLTIARKKPFSSSEVAKLKSYFEHFRTEIIFPSNTPSAFNGYADAFREGSELKFVERYPLDISVISDDSPFFYKQYKLRDFLPWSFMRTHHTGTIVFMTQFLVFLQAIIFILLFIFLPLYVFKKRGLQIMPQRAIPYFVLFFGCIGAGFMLFEISAIQHLILLLGSPIYSISITLALLLAFSGIGSFLVSKFQAKFINQGKLVLGITTLLVFSILLFISISPGIQAYFLGFSLVWRVLAIALLLLPSGLCLGTFFPLGLELVRKNHIETVAWAWGINSSFTVLGSMGAIFLAQFYGFNKALMLAVALYCVAAISFVFLERILHPDLRTT